MIEQSTFNAMMVIMTIVACGLAYFGFLMGREVGYDEAHEEMEGKT